MRQSTTRSWSISHAHFIINSVLDRLYMSRIGPLLAQDQDGPLRGTPDVTGTVFEETPTPCCTARSVQWGVWLDSRTQWPPPDIVVVMPKSIESCRSRSSRICLMVDRVKRSTEVEADQQGTWRSPCPLYLVLYVRHNFVQCSVLVNWSILPCSWQTMQYWRR